MGLALNIICVACEKNLHCKSYNTLVRLLLGKHIGVTFEVVIIFYLFGSCIGYLIIVYDMFQPVAYELFMHIGSADTTSAFYSIVIQHNAVTSRAIILALFTFPVVLPLSLMRTISALRFSSAIAVFSVVYMVAAVSVKSIIHTSQKGVPSDVNYVANDAVGVATAIPLVCFAFQCQVNVPPIYGELKKELRTVAMFKKISICSYSICFLLYIPAGVFGYLYFGGATPSDILSRTTDGVGFDQSDGSILIARVCIMCAALSCYPLNHYPARAALYSLLFTKETTPYRPRNSFGGDVMSTPELMGTKEYVGIKPSDTSSHPEHNTSRWEQFFYMETGLFVVLTYGLAVVVQDLGYVMDICGSTAATIIIFIIPSQFLRITGEKTRTMKVLSWSLLIIGVSIMVVCLTTTILRIAGVLNNS